MAFIFTLLSANLYAETTDQDINKICLKHAVSLVDKLRAEGISSGDKTENKILRLAAEDCKQHFGAARSKTNVGKDNEKISSAGENEEKGDWFTEKILKSDTSRKEGNRRLKKMQHK